MAALKLKQAQKQKQEQVQESWPKRIINRVLVAFGVKLKDSKGNVWKLEAIKRAPLGEGDEGVILCTRGSGCGTEYRGFKPSEFGVKIDGDKLYQ